MNRFDTAVKAAKETLASNSDAEELRTSLHAIIIELDDALASASDEGHQRGYDEGYDDARDRFDSNY